MKLRPKDPRLLNLRPAPDPLQGVQMRLVTIYGERTQSKETCPYTGTPAGSLLHTSRSSRCSSLCLLEAFRGCRCGPLLAIACGMGPGAPRGACMQEAEGQRFSALQGKFFNDIRPKHILHVTFKSDD